MQIPGYGVEHVEAITTWLTSSVALQTKATAPPHRSNEGWQGDATVSFTRWCVS